VTVQPETELNFIEPFDPFSISINISPFAAYLRDTGFLFTYKNNTNNILKFTLRIYKPDGNDNYSELDFNNNNEDTINSDIHKDFFESRRGWTKGWPSRNSPHTTTSTLTVITEIQTNHKWSVINPDETLYWTVSSLRDPSVDTIKYVFLFEDGSYYTNDLDVENWWTLDGEWKYNTKLLNKKFPDCITELSNDTFPWKLKNKGHIGRDYGNDNDNLLYVPAYQPF